MQQQHLFFCGLWSLLAFWSLSVVPARAAEYFVAPDGYPTADGSRARPWNLGTALAQPPAVKPGDTIWMRGGTYHGGFTSTLQGRPEAAITVRPTAGERITIDCRPRDVNDDGLFTVNGAWTTFRDLEFTCSDPRRATAEIGSWPADIRRGGINSRGSHIKFINLIVHDTAQGFGFWGNDQSGAGGEIYGCLIYHNGWQGPDRGHGHAIYAQNALGTKRIVDNVMFNQFGYGLHAYGSDKAFLRGFHIEGNTAFNNGSLVDPSNRVTDVLVGGGTPLERVTVLKNYIYGGGLQLGYSPDVRNRGVSARDNYIVGFTRLTSLPQITFTGNIIIGQGTLLDFGFPLEGALQYHCDNNTYIRTKVAYAAFNIARNRQYQGATFAEWQKLTGFDTRSQYREAPATGTKIVVRPNQYEKGRAHIIVYNWDKKDAVEVKLNDLLQPGQRYRIVSAQNFYGEPVQSGTYDGRPVQVPMKPLLPVQPVGMPDYRLPVTEPQFGVFIVLPIKGI